MQYCSQGVILKMIGERIKQLRKDRNMNQIDLAEKTGISRVSIGFYERNERLPSVDLAARIAKALGVSLDDIMGWPVTGNMPADFQLSEEAINEHMEVYKRLDTHGREMVDLVTGAEYKRMYEIVYSPGYIEEE